MIGYSTGDQFETHADMMVAQSPNFTVGSDFEQLKAAEPAQFLTQNMEAAHADMNLTPQEKGLYQRHLDNLYGPGGVDNSDGTRSTLYTSTVTFGDKAYIVPSVHEGKILSNEEADAKAKKDGLDTLPSYSSHEEANARYQKLHDYMEKDTNTYEQLRNSLRGQRTLSEKLPGKDVEVTPTRQADFIGWLKNWVGETDTRTQTIKQEPGSKTWPIKEDVGVSKLLDQSHGDVASPYLEPGSQARLTEVSTRSAVDWFNKGTAFDGKTRPMTQTEAEDIHKAWLASEKSPVSKLGFNPAKFYVTPDANMTAAGGYAPKEDQIWLDTSSKSTPVHESIHRGIEMIRKEGLMPKDLERFKEENIVRALMVRHHGNIEIDREVPGADPEKLKAFREKIRAQAASIPDDKLDKLEKVAAEYVAKKRPGGPR